MFEKAKDNLLLVQSIEELADNYQKSIEMIESKRYNTLMSNVLEEDMKYSINLHFNKQRFEAAQKVREDLAG